MIIVIEDQARTISVNSVQKVTAVNVQLRKHTKKMCMDMKMLVVRIFTSSRLGPG